MIVGEEVKSSADDIIGLFLKEEIPKGLSPLETVDAIKSQGGLVMVPYPFDRVRPSAIKYEALQEILPHVDIMETFNCHNLFRRNNEMAEAFTKEHNLIAAVVSDSHTPLELGRTYMEVPEFDSTPEGLKNAPSQTRLVPRKAHHILPLTPVWAKLKGRLR